MELALGLTLKWNGINIEIEIDMAIDMEIGMEINMESDIGNY